MTTATEMRVQRDDAKKRTVLTIILDDHDLARNHLVRPTLTAPVDDLARYALHCIQVMNSETVEERTERLYENRRTWGWNDAPTL